MATRWWRLTGVAQIDGEVRQPGYEFELLDFVRPPMRTVSKRSDDDTYVMMVDEPLAVQIDAPSAT